MELNTPQSYILYLLGLIFEEFEKQQAGKPLLLALTKSDFIKIARRANLVSKQERAVYKNLETLEKDKLINYDNQSLALTRKGYAVFAQMTKRIAPYVRLTLTITSENLLSYARKVQTRFAFHHKP